MTEEEKYRDPSDTLAIGEAPPVLPRPVETAATKSRSAESSPTINHEPYDSLSFWIVCRLKVAIPTIVHNDQAGSPSWIIAPLKLAKRNCKQRFFSLDGKTNKWKPIFSYVQ